QRRAEMPNDARTVAVGDAGRRQEGRVVEMHQRKAMHLHEPPELLEVRRERGRLAPENKPSEAPGRAVPGMREERNRASVDNRATAREELGGRPLGYEYVCLVAGPQVLEDRCEARRGASKLRAVVDIEDRDSRRGPHDRAVDAFDAARILCRVEVRLGVR